MGKIAILIHGFNIWDRGAQTTDTLKPFLENRGWTVIELDYKWTGLVGARKLNLKLASKLRSLIVHYKALGNKVIVVGHSNGAAIAYLATKDAKYYESPHTLIAINPALRKDLEFGSNLHKILVFHSYSDIVTKWSKRLSRIIPKDWFEARPWGEMGRVGYKGNDKRVKNVDLEKLLGTTIRHSTVFDDDRYRQKIIKKISEELK